MRASEGEASRAQRRAFSEAREASSLWCPSERGWVAVTTAPAAASPSERCAGRGVGRHVGIGRRIVCRGRALREGRCARARSAV